MDLTDEDVAAFIEAWYADFRERLTPEDARAEETRLLEFVVELAGASGPQEPDAPLSADGAHQTT